SHYVVPERLYPWIGVVSGIIIAVLGGCLFLRRYAGETHTHSHAHTHAHTPPHSDVHVHTHAQSHMHHDSSQHKLAHHHLHPHGSPQGHHHEQGQTDYFPHRVALG